MINIFRNNQMQVNGVKITVPQGASICIQNGDVYINGEKYVDDQLEGKEAVNIIVEGDVKEVKCSGSVTVNGLVQGRIDCGGSVKVKGDVEASIDCGGSCTISGNHRGKIDAGGSVTTN